MRQPPAGLLLGRLVDGLGAVGGYAGLNNYTALGGQVTVSTLPN